MCSISTSSTRLLSCLLRHNVQCNRSKIGLVPPRLAQNASFSSEGSQQQIQISEDSAGQELITRKVSYPKADTPNKSAWLESMDTLQGEKLGLLDLHPDVFATYPRVDVIAQNIKWQERYRMIDYKFENNRAEMHGGGRKPWQQKGTGRARHGSIRSPIWKLGGQSHGPRGPVSHFYMLPKSLRALGLRVTLTCKHVQNDLRIVDSLQIPTSNPEYLTELADVRFWGDSVLFVDNCDLVSENIFLSTKQIKGFTVMPAYGLNVYSMVKHDTLVLTLAALERIERRLLDEMHSTERFKPFVNTHRPQDFHTHAPQDFTMYKKFTTPLELNRDFYDKPSFVEEIDEEEENNP